MAKGVLKWILLATALFLIGPAAGRIIGSVPAPDGGPATSLLLSSSTLHTLFNAATAFAFALLVGGIGARFFSLGTGLAAAGVVAAWTAAATGASDEIIRRTHDVNSFWTLTIEGVVVCIGLGALALLIGMVVPRVETVETKRKHSSDLSSLAAGLGLGLVIAAIAGWLVARSPLTGQAIAAAAAAGAAGALAAILSFHRVRSTHIVATLGLLAIVAPASAALLHGDAVTKLAYAGELTPLARITPLQWAAGLLLGVPLGASWGRSMITKKPDDPATHRA